MQTLLMQVEPQPEIDSKIPPDEMYDKIELAITCNENINDTELGNKILATGGKVMLQLEDAKDQLTLIGQKFGRSEC